MSKTVLLFLYPRTVSALESEGIGRVSYISRGASCQSIEEVDVFCDQVFSFKTDELMETETSYFIIDAGAKQQIRARFFLKLTLSDRKGSLALSEDSSTLKSSSEARRESSLARIRLPQCRLPFSLPSQIAQGPRVSLLFLDQALLFVVQEKIALTPCSIVAISYNGKGYRLIVHEESVFIEPGALPLEEDSLTICDEDFFALVQPRIRQESPVKKNQEESKKARENIKPFFDTPQPLEHKELPSKLYLQDWHQGKYVHFGQYEWLVLELIEECALLLSRHAVGVRCFDMYRSDWAKSEIRAYLNGDFCRQAFSAEERAHIIQIALTTETEGGAIETKDSVFLLSIDEAKAYFKSDKARICLFKGARCWYWLRSPGYSADYVAGVYENGELYKYGRFVSSDFAVRPALWVNLGS